MATTPLPSFGSNIRAARLGWRWSDRHGAFIRMSDAGPGQSLIELAPADGLPGTRCSGGFHRCWWEQPGILDMIPWLRPVRRVKRLVRVVVDDEGNPARG